jgi:hypothetical protein
MKTGVPEQEANERIRSNTAGISKAVGVLGHFTVSMFEVTKIIHNRISKQDWNNPPKEHGLKTSCSASKDHKESDPMKDLNDGSLLQILHDARLFTVGPFVERPSGATIVHGNSTCREKDATQTTFESARDIEKHLDVSPSREGNVPKSRVFQCFSIIVAGELWILVNVVGKSVVLLVHDSFMLAKLAGKDTGVEETQVVDPLGLECVAMKELVLSSKRKTLELETVEKVKRDKDSELCKSQALCLEWKNLKLMDRVGGQAQNGKISEESLEAFIVRLLHEADQDTVVEQSVTLLALRVLDVGPIFTSVGDVLETIGISLAIEHLGESWIIGIDSGENWSCVGSHGRRGFESNRLYGLGDCWVMAKILALENSKPKDQNL